MAEKKSAKKTAPRNSSSKFTAEERAAMRERAREAKANASREEAEKALLDQIKKMPKPDRTMAERIHAIVTNTAPSLAPRTWYGMPAWAKDGKVVCFFQSAAKFKSRYATIGFSDNATLDKGTMWPTSFAVKELTAADEKKIAALVKQAVKD